MTRIAAKRPSQLNPARAEPQASEPHQNCNLTARAIAVPGAQARLSVKAPCHGNARVKVHHSGLTVTQITDENGAFGS